MAHLNLGIVYANLGLVDEADDVSKGTFKYLWRLLLRLNLIIRGTVKQRPYI